MNVIAVVLAALLPVVALPADPKDQWLYRELDGAEQAPAAIYLDPSYSKVMLRARCDEASGELVVEYFGDGVAALAAHDEMELIAGDDVLPLRTTLSQDRLVGRTPAADLLRAWPATEDLVIQAPTADDQPWVAGKAEPLRTVAADCTAITP